MTAETAARISEGEAYLPDAAGLCERLNIVALNMYEGNLYALVTGKGEVLLSDLIAQDGRAEVETAGKVTSIKRKP